MQSGARSANLTRDQGEVDQAAGIVRAVRVLRNSHAPKDDRRVRSRIGACNGPQRLGVDPADIRHLLRRIILQMLTQRLEAVRSGLDELLVVQPFLDDHMQHRVQHGDVGPRLELQHMGRMFAQGLAPRVADDQRLARLRLLLEERRGNRMILRWIGADDHHHFRIFTSGEGRRDRTGADAFHQGRHG